MKTIDLNITQPEIAITLNNHVIAQALTNGGYPTDAIDLHDIVKLIKAKASTEDKLVVVAIFEDDENSDYDEEDELIQAYCVDNLFFTVVDNVLHCCWGGCGETYYDLDEAVDAAYSRR